MLAKDSNLLETQGASQALAVRGSDHGWKRSELPAWLASVVLHAAILLVVAVALPKVAKRGMPFGNTSNVIGSIGEGDPGPPEYFTVTSSGGEFGGDASAALPASPFPSSTNSNPSSAGLPALPTDSVSGAGLAGADGTGGTGLPSAGSLTKNGRPGGGTYGTGGSATDIFGVAGRGSKIIYVFDRSASMGDYGGRPLAMVKQQLVRSLSHLSETTRFQMIFYNERPTVFNPDAPNQPRMMYGDQQSKRLAENFIDSISAAGGTQHWDALRMAINMRPDAIFFLTDGTAEPLTAAQLQKIQLECDEAGISINVIEFGSGAQRSKPSFLRRLATNNGGQYGYVDVTRLVAGAQGP